jgi:signal transduction histidine kinase/response regulator RpfG family c-di-GMP phosphodiesterase
VTEAENRVLVLAPWGRDAAVISQVLAAAGIDALQTPSSGAFLAAFADGAGLALITEEALTPPFVTALAARLADQPPWSDFPFVVLAAKHHGPRHPRAQGALDRLGNVMLLERPLHAETLLSAARSALRGRRRQYETRHHLEAQHQAATQAALLLEAEQRAKAATREATDALAFALTAAELGTFHCPLPLGEVEWNPTCRAHFWLAPDSDERIGVERFFAIVHPEDREQVRADVQRAIDAREPYDVEYRTLSPDGGFRWLRAKGMAHGPPGRPAVRFDGITIDISAQKALEGQRERLLAAERAARLQAEHASRMKDEFLATLSHELRTPLAAIIGWTHVLRRSAAAENARAVDTIERNARTQSRLIDDLLDMSRIVSGNLRLDMELVDLATVTDTVLASLEPTAQTKHLTVGGRRGAKRPLVRGDASRLQQIVWNLLSNAFKFTPAGGQVSITLGHEADRVVLVVEDSGQGIPESFLPFVFDRFRQSDASSTRAHGGLGLGLAIVKNLVELHGGAVAAASDGPGRGARFEIHLPPADGGVRASGDTHEADPGAPCARSGHDFSGVRILVVDDEPDLCELLQHELEACGATVYAVRSGAEAAELIESHRPHLLISDIGMPDEDGHALLRRIRAMGAHRGGDLPAIALTAFAGPDDRARALASGFLTHIAKPMDMGELLDQVAATLNATASHAF